MMAGIRGRNTRPEVALRKVLYRAGFRYRLHSDKLPGRPDLVFPSRKAVVLVNGCFWHRHPGCRFATTPKSNDAFWAAKFAANIQRDDRVRLALRSEGWRVLVVWECALHASKLQGTGAAVARWLASPDQPCGEVPSCNFSTI